MTPTRNCDRDEKIRRALGTLGSLAIGLGAAWGKKSPEVVERRIDDIAGISETVRLLHAESNVEVRWLDRIDEVIATLYECDLIRRPVGTDVGEMICDHVVTGGDCF